MTYEEIVKQIKNGGLVAEESTTTTKKEIAEIKIKEAKIIDGDHPSIDHPLFASGNGTGQTFIAFIMDVKTENGIVKNHVELTNVLTQKGKLNYYKGFETKDGQYAPSSLLYEITKAVKDYSAEQESKFPEPFKLQIENYTNMKFKFEVKILKTGNLMLMTEKRKQADKKYIESLQQSEHQEIEEAPKAKDDELPF
jgi:hypothetical protein